MGYVRMIKAGGLHFLSNSIRFVPDLDDIPKFENLSVDEGLNTIPETIEAAKTLDLVVENLSQNFTDSTEYFDVCPLGVKGRNMKMDLNIYGTWCWVGQ